MPKPNDSQLTFDQMQGLNRYIKTHCPQITGWAYKANRELMIFGQMSIVGAPYLNTDLTRLTKQQADRITDLEDQLYALGLNPDTAYNPDDLAAIRTIISGVLAEGAPE